MSNGFDLTTITSVLSITTFIIGVLLGVIIKRAIKLALAIVSLVVLLAVTGYLNLAWSTPSANTIYYVFNGAQPVADQAIGSACTPHRRCFDGIFLLAVRRLTLSRAVATPEGSASPAATEIPGNVAGPSGQLDRRRYRTPSLCCGTSSRSPSASDRAAAPQ